jgi:hypothetical protein
MSHIKTLKSTLTCFDHHQGAHLFLVKNHLIKIRVVCGDVVMQQHNMLQSLHNSPHHTPRKTNTCYAAALPHHHI